VKRGNVRVPSSKEGELWKGDYRLLAGTSERHQKVREFQNSRKSMTVQGNRKKGSLVGES